MDTLRALALACFLLAISIAVTFGRFAMPVASNPVPNWVERITPIKAEDVRTIPRRYEHDYSQLPLVFHNSGSEARVVVDRLTGEQLWAINKGFLVDGETHFRVLRFVLVRVDGKQGPQLGGWWSIETRRLDELKPIPSV